MVAVMCHLYPGQAMRRSNDNDQDNDNDKIIHRLYAALVTTTKFNSLFIVQTRRYEVGWKDLHPCVIVPLIHLSASTCRVSPTYLHLAALLVENEAQFGVKRA
jgi:hypothetical protein